MNLSQLQYFRTLAKEEHYTRAAQILSITQPSLSHAIAQLEQELGTRLFEKKGRNVVLTRYGKIFLPYVEESLNTVMGICPGSTPISPSVVLTSNKKNEIVISSAAAQKFGVSGRKS